MPLMHIKRSAAISLVSYRVDRCSRVFLSAVVLQCNRGWILLYIVKTASGSLSGLSQAQYGALFASIIQNPVQTLAAQLVFMVLTVIVVARGVQKGIERVSAVMMPILFLLFILLVLRSLTLNGAMEGVKFLLVPHFGDLTPESILFALGQAFFTLTLGVSVMVTYSSYLPKTQNIPRSADLHCLDEYHCDTRGRFGYFSGGFLIRFSAK